MLLTVAAGYQLRRERELARLREDFVASVSHELRTPLAQIRLFAETLRLGRIRSESERDRSLEIVEHESKRLEHLVENVLHFSRAERGTQRIRLELTDLTALVEQVVSEFRPLGERTGSRFRTCLAPEVTAHVDPAAIRQVLLNLLDNAIKYGPRGQVVSVRLAAGPAGIQLEVEDQGPGVPAASRGRVWERFWRDESVRAAGVAGTGIGLAIVGDLVARQGGSATIIDAVPHGARVIITLGNYPV
jgi:signal transduction histidine kinase